MKEKRLLLIGVHDGCCDRAHQRGIEFTLLQKPENSDGKLNRSLNNVLLLDFENSPYIKPIITAMHKQAPFDHAVSITELGLLPAAKINEYLKLGGTSPKVVERTRDKLLMRKHLDKLSFPNLKAARLESRKQLKDFGSQVGFPLIIKPINGAGSVQILFLKNSWGVDKISDKYFNQKYIVEEFADGEEYSVETFSFNKKHIVFGITKKLLSSENKNCPFIEVGHLSPASLSQKQKDEIHDFICRFLDVIGIKDGLAHTEIKLTSKGIRVIETHNRNGGDHIADLTRLSTGYDLLDYALAWPTGLVKPLKSHLKAKRGSAILYFQLPENNTVRSIMGIERLRYEPGIVKIELLLEPGQNTQRIKSSYDRVGFVVASAETAEVALKICEKVINEIQIIFTK